MWLRAEGWIWVPDDTCGLHDDEKEWGKYDYKFNGEKCYSYYYGDNSQHNQTTENDDENRSW